MSANSEMSNTVKVSARPYGIVQSIAWLSDALARGRIPGEGDRIAMATILDLLKESGFNHPDPTGEIPAGNFNHASGELNKPADSFIAEMPQWIHETIRRLRAERSAGAQLTRTMDGWLTLADALRDAELASDNWKIDHARLLTALEEEKQAWLELHVERDNLRLECERLTAAAVLQQDVVEAACKWYHGDPDHALGVHVARYENLHPQSPTSRT